MLTENNSDETDKPPKSYHVTYMDLAGLIFSIIFHFLDVGYDFYVAYSYFNTGKYTYFACTVAFFVIPTVVITFVSIRMYVEDCKNNINAKYALLRIFLCIFGIFLQSALLVRYCDSFKYAIKALKAERRCDRKQQENYYTKMLNEDSDIALLRVFECYLESAPQQVLQATLLLLDYSQGHDGHKTKQIVFIFLGFLSMGWCMANYHRCIRFDQQDILNISALGIVTQFFWHLNFTVSRILALVAVATLYSFWTFIAVVCHWCIMTIWIVVTNKTNFCGKNQIFEIFFSSSIGLIYIFNYISLKEGPTRNNYIIFYLFFFVENVLASIVWGIKSTLFINNWIYYIFIVFPVFCFVLSVVFLGIYYKFLHPNKLKSMKVKSKQISYGGKSVEEKISFTSEPNNEFAQQ